MRQTLSGTRLDPTQVAEDRPISFRSIFPTLASISSLIFTLTVGDGAWRGHDDPAFVNLTSIDTTANILIAGVLAALLAGILVLAVQQISGGGEETTTAVLAAVLLVGYLARLHEVSTSASFVVLAIGSALMFALMALGRKLGEDDVSTLLKPRIFLGFSVSTIALFAAIVVSSLTLQEANLAVAGIRPVEVLRYLLFIVVSAVLSARRPTSRSKGSRRRNPKRLEITCGLWVAAAPTGLLFATSSLGASLVLAAGFFTVLLTRPLPRDAGTWGNDGSAGVPLGHRLRVTLAAMAGYGVACSLWSMFSPTFDAYREKAGLVFDPDQVWRAARTAGAHWTGLGPGADGLSDNGLGYERVTVTLVEQYGIVYTALALLILAALMALLARAALRARRTTAGAVALGLVAMPTTAVALSGIALLANVSLGVGVPLFSADATSFVLTLGAIGFVIGVGAGTRSPTADDTATEQDAVGDQPEPRAHPTPGRRVPRQIQDHRYVAVTAAIALPLFAVAYAAVPLRVSEATTYNIKAPDGTLLGHATKRNSTITVDPRPRLPAAFVPAAATPIDNPDGPTITVTLDPATQNRATSALGDNNGAIVVIDTADGAVQAATHRGAGWEPISAKPAPGLAGLVTIAGSKKELIDPPQAIAMPAVPTAQGAVPDADPGVMPDPASSGTKKCEGPQPLADALLTDSRACDDRINRLADTSADSLLPFACSFSFADPRPPFGEIQINGSSFINRDLCIYMPQQRQNLLGSTRVSLNITPLEAAGLAMFLAADPTPMPTRACPHLEPTQPPFCVEQNAPADPAVATMIRDAMKKRGSAGGVALAVFDDRDTTWVIGYTLTTKPATAVAVVLGPDVGRDEAARIAIAALTTA